MTALQRWFTGIDLSRISEWLMFGAAAILAICVHESAHGLAALWLGDDTAKRMHRITLNPLRHLDPLGFAMMVFAHFGWARPVPVNPYRMTKIKNRKLGMALTAAAGPISNILLAVLSCFCFCMFFYKGSAAEQQMLAGYAPGSGLRYVLGSFCWVSAVLNTGLAVFNLIPISPLDGSKILAIVLPDRAHQWLMRYERYGFFILAALLFMGILDVPLSFLRSGLLEGILAVVEPLARLLTGNA